MIKSNPSRPLSCGFTGGDDVNVTFTEQGSLGLKFTQNTKGQVEVLAINPGTQATRHQALKPGLVLASVGATDVTGMKYKEVINVIKSNPSRPLSCGFTCGGSVKVGGGQTISAASSTQVKKALVSAPPLAPIAVCGSIKVSFTEQGSLGLKFTQNTKGQVEVLAINPELKLRDTKP